MIRRQCQNCRHFVRALGELTGECRIRSVPQDDFPKRAAGEDCGEWQDGRSTAGQHERRELVRQFALAIVEGVYANPDDVDVHVMLQAKRYADRFIEAMQEGQT